MFAGSASAAGGRLVAGQLAEVRVVEGEALEFLLVDGAHQLRVDWCQHRLLFGEFGVEVQHVLFVFLQMKKK